MLTGVGLRLCAVLLMVAVRGGVSTPPEGDLVPHSDGDPTAVDLLEDGAITPTIPTPPPVPTTEGSVIELQEQIYIVSGVLGFFLLVLLIVSLAAAYLAVSLRHKIRTLHVEAQPAPRPVRQPASQQQPAARGQRAPAPGPAGPTGAPPRARQPPQQQQGRDNRAYMGDDGDESGGEEVNQRYSQYPGAAAPQGRGREARGSRASGAAQPYDRFHQPMPDQYLPSEERERQQDPNSRYGAGNLARLPKGPAPQPSGYDRGYPAERRPRSPVHAQW